MEWFLELVLVALLVVTLVHAVRLERALGVLRRDRGMLEEMVRGFNASTREAEQSVDRLRDAADGAGGRIAAQIETARMLQDDLRFLTERGERVADRMEQQVRVSRPSPAPLARLEPVPAAMPALPNILVAARAEPVEPRVRSQAERDLLRALRMAR